MNEALKTMSGKNSFIVKVTWKNTINGILHPHKEDEGHFYWTVGDLKFPPTCVAGGWGMGLSQMGC